MFFHPSGQISIACHGSHASYSDKKMYPLASGIYKMQVKNKILKCTLNRCYCINFLKLCCEEGVFIMSLLISVSFSDDSAALVYQQQALTSKPTINICCDRFCGLPIPLIINFLCLASLHLTRQEYKMKTIKHIQFHIKPQLNKTICGHHRRCKKQYSEIK